MHYYLPMMFTHQGASWAAGSDAWMGTKWSASEEEQQTIINDFNTADAWARERGLPVYLGEFGAYSAADMESRSRWTAYITKQAEARGWSWAYWEFCAGFGAYDPDAQQWREPLLKALIP